jgi:hypothetical protein
MENLQYYSGRDLCYFPKYWALKYVRFESFMVVSIKITVFWDNDSDKSHIYRTLYICIEGYV